MSDQPQPIEPGDPAQERAVVDHLSRHLNFFERHPDLLAHLYIPHPDTGEAVSLLERQVSVLREQKNELSRKLQHLAQVARSNERLLERMQSLMLALIDSPDLDAARVTLERALREDFEADAVTVHLFPANEGAAGAELAIFDTLVKQGKPLCGELPAEQFAVLFPEHAATMASGVVIPLCETAEGACVGVLGLGSVDRKRFHAEMGTVFLSHLGAVAARVLKARQVVA